MQGLDLAERQVQFLLADEGASIAFFDDWSSKGQPKLTVVLHTPLSDAAAYKPASPRIPAASAQTLPKAYPPTRQPSSGLAISALSAAIAAYLLIGTWFSLLIAVTAIGLGIGSLTSGRGESYRWRRLAIAAMIIVPIAILLSAYQFVRN